MDLTQLTDDQMEKLRQFQDIANLEETDIAVVSLASCDWNLEHAIEAHLGGAPAALRRPPVGISHLDYVHDFEDEPMMMEEPRGRVARGFRDFAAQMMEDDGEAEEPLQQQPPQLRGRGHGHAAYPLRSATAAAAAAAASDESVASSSSSKSSNHSKGGGAKEKREAAGQSSSSTSTAVSMSPAAARAAAAVAAAAAAPDAADHLVPVVVPAARAAAASAASSVRMLEDSDEELGSDDDYDYAMEEQPEEEEEREARISATLNGSSARRGGAPNDFGVPLIPTDCNSALEGTQNFQSVFEARYGKDGRGHLMPPFFIGSLGSAIREAFDCPDRPVSERRPLALYIHHDRSVARNIFPQAVLCNDNVLALLRSQFIVWPWDVTARENQDKLTTWLSECSLYDARPIVSSFLAHVDRFPVLILLTKDGSQLRMVEFVNGSEGPDQAMEKLLMCMDAYASSKLALEKQEQERVERELLRKEQERELQESLAVDRERAERQAREAREAKEAEEAAAKEKEQREVHLATLKSSLPEEPEEKAKGCCAVRFRLPESKVAMRRFPDSCTLASIFMFMESEGYSVKEYRMMNSDFPQKKDICEWDANSTLAQLKWPAREVINVEER